MLGRICILTYSSPTYDCSLLLYYTLVSPKSEYASSVLSNIMTTKANWLEHIQQSLQLYASVAFFFIIIFLTTIFMHFSF